MEFSDITSSVHDVWTFIWPPIIMIGLTYYVIKFLLPGSTGDFYALIFNNLKSNSAKIEELRKQLEIYGLGKIIPISSLILLIFTFYLLNGPITQLASKLPPYLSYMPSAHIEMRASELDKLHLLRSHPSAENLSEAYNLSLEEIASQGYEPKYNRVEIHYKIQNFIKYAFLVALIILIYSAYKKEYFLYVLARMIPLTIVIIMFWVFTFPFLLFNQEQELYDEWRAIEINLQKNTISKEPPTALEKLKIEGFASRGWWQVKLWDTSIISWSKRTLNEKLKADQGYRKY